MRMPPFLRSCFFAQLRTCLSTFFFHRGNAVQNSGLQAAQRHEQLKSPHQLLSYYRMEFDLQQRKIFQQQNCCFMPKDFLIITELNSLFKAVPVSLQICDDIQKWAKHFLGLSQACHHILGIH